MGIKYYFLFLGIILLPNIGFGQLKYVGRLESGFLKYGFNTVFIKPGQGWKGYDLNENQNGIDFNFINSIRLDKKKSLGIGLAYCNFEGYPANAIFLDFQNSSKKNNGSIFNFKVGQNHLYNQYSGGQKSILVEFGFGKKYIIPIKSALKWQIGMVFMHKALIFPIRIGVNF
jgi:hypothetical protein